MTIILEYGKEGLPLELPDGVMADVLTKPAMPTIKDVAGVLNQSLSRPVDAAPIERIAASRQSVCIAVCDITRPVPNGIILPVLIHRLISSGVPAEKIRIVIATGLHDPNEGRRLKEVIGDQWTLDHIEIVNHCAGRDQDHVDLGTTPGGTRVLLDSRFINADLRIVIGLVEPHFMAGYSGGRKLIAPGLSHSETIRRLHSHAVLGNEKACNCNLRDNPLHDEQLAIAKMTGEVYAINVVLDSRRNIGFINFGELIRSHCQAVDFLRKYAELSITREYSTVVTTGAGYPLDSSYYQTVKAMTGAMYAVRPGGGMFIASACTDGLGSEAYRAAQTRLFEQRVDRFLMGIKRKTHADIDEWQTQMQIRAMKRCDIHLFTTGLNQDDERLTCVNMVRDLKEAVSEWTDQCKDRRIAVIPEGPYVIPMPLDAA